MRSIILYISFLLICSCKEKQEKAKLPDQTTVSTDSAALQGNGYKILYVERDRDDFKNYSVTIYSMFDIPDSVKYDSSYYHEGTFLSIYDKNNNNSDTLKLELDTYDARTASLENFSDSLHFKSLVLCINWIGDSDQPGSEFVEYSGDTLKKLFTINNLISLERKDEWTLSGFVAGRDEIVSSGQQDYPLTISLKDYEVQVTDPDIQSIGYPTTALENFKAFRDPTLNKKFTYTIKKGKSLVVDSIFRSLKLVRLVVSDTIVLYARPDEVSKKVEHNNAG